MACSLYSIEFSLVKRNLVNRSPCLWRALSTADRFNISHPTIRNVKTGSSGEVSRRATANPVDEVATEVVEPEDWVGRKLGFESRSDWLQLMGKDLYNNHGRSLLDKYGSSPAKAIAAIYPEWNFLPWEFKGQTQYFKSLGNRKRFVDWLMAKVGVSTLENLTFAHFLQNGGQRLLNRYDGSVANVIDSLKKEDEAADSSNQGNETLSDIDLGSPRPNGYWNDIQNQRRTLDAIGKSIGVLSTADLGLWYRLSYRELRGFGLGSLMKSRYSNSPFKMLKAIYPEFDWKPWHFEVFPRRIGGKEEVLKECLDHIASSLSITSLSQWYRVSYDQLESLGVLNVIQKHGGLFSCLKKTMPELEWDESKFVGVSHYGDKILNAHLSKLFPTEIFVSNPTLHSSRLGREVNFTLACPKLKIIFEYQKDKVYGLSESFGKVAVTLLEPFEKVEASKENSYSLVFVPFWWDRNIESLAKTIIKIRPELKDQIISSGLSADNLEEATAIPRSEVVQLSNWRRIRRS